MQISDKKKVLLKYSLLDCGHAVRAAGTKSTPKNIRAMELRDEKAIDLGNLILSLDCVEQMKFQKNINQIAMGSKKQYGASASMFAYSTIFLGIIGAYDIISGAISLLPAASTSPREYFWKASACAVGIFTAALIDYGFLTPYLKASNLKEWVLKAKNLALHSVEQDKIPI